MSILLLIIAVYLISGLYLAKKNQLKRLVLCLGLFYLVSNIPIIESLSSNTYTLAYNYFILPVCAIFNLYVITYIGKSNNDK